MDKTCNRKQFFAGVGRACVCSCVGAMAASLGVADAQESEKKASEKAKAASVPAKVPRSHERIEFTEKWAVRFFKVFDENLDEATRTKVMMANGKACLLAWQRETNQKPRPQAVTLENFAKWVKASQSTAYRVEGNVIYHEYTVAAETGLPSPEKHCLCPMVETNPPGLSPTYCLCSLGYVKEMHEQLFKKPVKIELLSSVLRGDARCKFKMTVG
jgi:hypothetical protein